jgi:hypothetical protein
VERLRGGMPRILISPALDHTPPARLPTLLLTAEGARVESASILDRGHLMKTNYFGNVAPLVCVTALSGFLASCSDRRPTADKPTEVRVTNTVEVWRTNTVEKWRTNVVQNPVELWRTNTVVQTVTNEVIREVPAQLTVAQQEAATTGYKFIHAPSLAAGNALLYKASPLAVDVNLSESARILLTEDQAAAVTSAIERALRAHGIPVAPESPHHLGVGITLLWTTGRPSVADFLFRLDLQEPVVLRRQGDLVQCRGVSWTSTSRRLVGTENLAEAVSSSLMGQVEAFCADYLKTRDGEKEIQSRLPSVPLTFLPPSQ